MIWLLGDCIRFL